MIKLVFIDELMAVNIKRVKKRVTNQEEDFKTLGIVFSSCTDSFYGEAVQRDVDDIVALAKDGLIQKQLCWVNFECTHRIFKGKEGDIHRTEIRVRKIIPAMAK